MFIVLDFVLSVLGSTIFVFIPNLAYDISTKVGYVFGNMWLLNDMLPIADLFIIAAIAITLKTVLFSFKVVLFIMSFFNVVKRTFISFRG